jgi:hypothetical protein
MKHRLNLAYVSNGSPYLGPPLKTSKPSVRKKINSFGANLHWFAFFPPDILQTETWVGASDSALHIRSCHHSEFLQLNARIESHEFEHQLFR